MKLLIQRLWLDCMLRWAILRLVFPFRSPLLTNLRFGVLTNTITPGIVINLEGYSQKAFLLLEEIVKGMKAFSPTQEDFDNFSHTLKRKFSNTLYSKPINQGFDLIKEVLVENFSTPEKKLESLGEFH